MAFGARTREPSRAASVGAVAALGIGIGGIALGITLLFLGMRAVMDVGGMCAEGGPYEIATTCPEGSTAATLLGVFGLFGFGGLTMWAGARLGGAWTGAVGLAWVALFAVLGWNFLEYGIISPPEGEAIVWGWLIPGVMFEVMAFGPVVFVIWGLRAARPMSTWPGSSPGSIVVRPLAGPRQRDRSAAVSPSFAAAEARAAAARLEPATAEEVRQTLAGIAAAMGSAVTQAEASAPADPVGRTAPAHGSEAFTEGTQALLDRLERLADMRDRGLLRADEFETAKAAIIQELEARS